MTLPSRTNLYQLLSKEIRVTDKLIDVGCGFLYDLIDFEHSDFKTLEGLDRELYQPFIAYRKIKGQKSHSHESFQQFKKRFNLSKVDFRNHDFEKDRYSLIICKHVLHFYPDNEKHLYLNTFFNSLQKDALLFVKLNHNDNKDNTDPSEMLEIKTNVFRNLKYPDDVRYLIDPDDFLSEVRSKYSLLESYTMVDEKAVTLVIRKT